MCYRPTINKYTKQRVPCGKCFACRVNKMNDWATRLMMESETTPPCWFVTLTYKESALPSIFMYDSHVKPLFRELKRLGTFRYYCIGEHGTEKGRLHYHFISFGASSNALYDVLTKWWRNGHTEPRESDDPEDFGFFRMGELSSARVMYVSLFHTLTEKKRGEFATMSKNPGIGGFYTKILRDEIKQNLDHSEKPYLTVDTERRRIPRYFFTKIDFKAKELWQEKSTERIEQEMSEILGRYVSIYEHLTSEDYAELRRYYKEIERRKVDTFYSKHRKTRHIDRSMYYGSRNSSFEESRDRFNAGSLEGDFVKIYGPFEKL